MWKSGPDERHGKALQRRTENEQVERVSPYSQLVRSMVSTSFPLGSREIRKGSQHTSTCLSWKQRARRLRLASAVLVPGRPLASFFWLVVLLFDQGTDDIGDTLQRIDAQRREALFQEVA